MSGFIDSVHKVFILRHDGLSMHIDSFVTDQDAAIGLLRRGGRLLENAAAFKVRLEHEIAREIEFEKQLAAGVVDE